MVAWLGLIASAAGMGVSAAGKESSMANTIEGAKANAEIEKKNRAFQTRNFDKQIARQKPFVDVGKLALPAFIEAISNRGSVSELPGTKIQGDLISNFLGPNAPDFIKEKALKNLEAVELEGNKGRLSDLVSIGLGGAGATTGSRMNLGSVLGDSLSRGSNLAGQGLQAAAQSRQNVANQLTTGLAGIPAFMNAQTRQRGGGLYDNPY